jgi:hypothetical protein
MPPIRMGALSNLEVLSSSFFLSLSSSSFVVPLEGGEELEGVEELEELEEVGVGKMPLAFSLFTSV